MMKLVNIVDLKSTAVRLSGSSPDEGSFCKVSVIGSTA
jgi:hypothetical protein